MGTNDVDAFMARADVAGVPVARVGVVGGRDLRIGSMVNVGVDDVTSRRRGALGESLAALG
jgi:hypothetical protein